MLALAYRVLHLSSKQEINFSDNWEREEAEKNLNFAGFFITESPLKKETKSTIQRLQSGNFKIIMITGDNILTANSIGKQLQLGATDIYLTVCFNKSKQEIDFYDEDNKKFNVNNYNNNNNNNININNNNLQTVSNNYTLCICGDQLQLLNDNLERQRLLQIVRNITIFARTSPS